MIKIETKRLFLHPISDEEMQKIIGSAGRDRSKDAQRRDNRSQ